MVSASADADGALKGGAAAARTDAPEARGRLGRVLLSLFFVLHWGAIAAYLLPVDDEALEPLPAWMRPVAAAAIPPARAAWPLARPYLDLTGTRQHWTLFAPEPADWVPSVRVVAHFPEVHAGTGWRADTVLVRGPREAAYPHLLHHRTYRVLFNIGYEAWGVQYRRLFAREMCRSLPDAAGHPPAGVELMATWHSMPLPWRDEAPARAPYEQWLGGFDCGPDPRPPEAPWPAYGLPARIGGGPPADVVVGGARP